MMILCLKEVFSKELPEVIFLNKIKFAVLDIKEGLRVIEANVINWLTLCSYLHEDYLAYEHPTTIDGIWMLEDDAFEYACSGQGLNHNFVNTYSIPFSRGKPGAIGSCVLFRPGERFGEDGNFNDIISLTEQDLTTIKERVDEIKKS